LTNPLTFTTLNLMTNDIIIKRLKIIQDLTEELNVLREQYQDALENDPQYQEIQQKTTEFKDETKEEKEKVLSNSTYSNIADSMKEKKKEINEIKEVLAHELVDYYRENGTLEFTDHNGNVKKIKFSARLVS
jgi:cell pole-organizing protein PopZ